MSEASPTEAPATAAGRPPLTWDDIVVGRAYADTWIDVEAGGLAAYAASVMGSAGGPAAPGRAAHVMAASWTIPRVTFHAWKVPDGALHAGQAWRFVREVAAGDRLHVVTRAAERFEAKGRSFVVFKSELADAAGRPVGSGTMTMVWPR